MEMSSGRGILFLFLILIHLIGLTISQPDFIASYCNFGRQGNYTNNSIYRTNLDSINSSLSTNANFYNFSIGQIPDEVNAIGLCRGDVDSDICRICLNEANLKLRQLCPNEKEAIGWYDNCMLRYSDRPIFHIMETLPNAYAYNLKNATNVVQFNKVVRTLIDQLGGEAEKGGSIYKFATGNMTGPEDLMVYGLVQCTPDLSERQCNECLNGAAGVLPTCCDGRLGGRVLRPSCNLRYEVVRFYNENAAVAPTPAVAPPPAVVAPPEDAAQPPPPGNGVMEAREVALITVSTFTAAMIAILVL